jgi:6-phosphogluconolactonase (cycloisomerase 2 family)
MLNWMRKRRQSRRVAALRARPGVEALEARAVPAAVATVFSETNDPDAGQNAVLAFDRGADGGLRLIGKFRTHGTGQLNVPKVVGPDDSSQEVVATPDGRFLFAVNQGSNTVAAFRIKDDGKLSFIDTFASGGVQPDSIGIAGRKLYVSNRGDSTATTAGTVAPNITGFTIDPDGSLSPIPGGTVTFPVNTIPSQNLISSDGRFLFADIFAANGTSPQGNTLAPFQVQGNGTLTLAPGGNVAGQNPDSTAAPPALLGADVNPHRHIVYAGLTGLAEVAVFTYDETGRLSFVGATAPNGDGGAGPCWVAVSPDGKFLYTGDTGSDSVGAYSLADPLRPVQIQEFFLGGPLTPPGSPPGTARQTTVFQVAVDPSGRFVYAIGQNTSATGTFPDGNQLHVLAVARDGTLSEPQDPVLFTQAGVPGDAHPQGIAVVAGVGDRDHGHHGTGDSGRAGGDNSDHGAAGGKKDGDASRGGHDQADSGGANGNGSGPLGGARGGKREAPLDLLESLFRD